MFVLITIIVLYCLEKEVHVLPAGSTNAAALACVKKVNNFYVIIFVLVL